MRKAYCVMRYVSHSITNFRPKSNCPGVGQLWDADERGRTLILAKQMQRTQFWDRDRKAQGLLNIFALKEPASHGRKSML